MSALHSWWRDTDVKCYRNRGGGLILCRGTGKTGERAFGLEFEGCVRVLRAGEEDGLRKGFQRAGRLWHQTKQENETA